MFVDSSNNNIEKSGDGNQENNEKESQTLANTAAIPMKSYPKPKQDVFEIRIKIIESELNCLVTKRDAGLAEDGIEPKIKKMRKELLEVEKELKEKKTKAEWQKKFRLRKRQKLLSLAQEHPEAASFLSVRNDMGRPHLEECQDGLLQAICDIALHSGSADDKRRSEAIRACKTLKNLQEELKDLGFNLCKSSLYLRLIPRNSTTLEGKRHVVTVPVKLCRAQADHHRDHADQHFCRATINSLEEIPSILGPHEVCFISQDDKAKVPLGMTAAKAQSPILMHLEYKVRLPDHDWMVGPRHKLTPSVYVGIIIKSNCMGLKEAVTHSGPTFIAVRSGKHCSSTASTHAADFERLIELDDFNPIIKQSDGSVKPILMLSVDGGPDENPRYKKVIAHAIMHFKKYNFDAIFIFTNAPGRSAFNRVERRMAPLSRVLSGVFIPHNYHGDHLDGSGNTTDEKLEKENFELAGEVLAETFSEVCIDGYNVVAKFIPIDEQVSDPVMCTDEIWYSNHVRESQYLLQIIKCDNLKCCSAHRSNLRKIIYQKFLPGPFPVTQQPFGIPSPTNYTVEKFPSFLLRQSLTLRPEFSQSKEIPYDFYCPSIQGELSKRTCPQCGLYFASKISMDNHRKRIHKYASSVSRVQPLQVLNRRPGELLCKLNEDIVEWVDVETVEEDISMDHQLAAVSELEDSVPVINDIGQWIADGIPFVDEN